MAKISANTTSMAKIFAKTTVLLYFLSLFNIACGVCTDDQGTCAADRDEVQELESETDQLKVSLLQHRQYGKKASQTTDEAKVHAADDGKAKSSWWGSPPSEKFYSRVVPVNKDQPVIPGWEDFKFAVALSGGGTRATTAAIGQVRGLTNLGLMEHMDGISGVSGGTWFLGPYMFAKNLTSPQLLGNATRPSELTMQELNQVPSSAIGRAATQDATELIIALSLDPFVKMHDAWIYTVGELYLKPFDLFQLHGKRRYLASDASTVKRILRHNRLLTRDDFVVPATDRTRPKNCLFVGSLLSPVGYTANQSNIVSIQFSPDFSGSPFHPDASVVSYTSSSWWSLGLFSKKVLVGGGFVESFAFGGDAPSIDGRRGGDNVEVPRPETPFDLATAIGVSSAAFAETATHFTGFDWIDPRRKVWPILGDPISRECVAHPTACFRGAMEYQMGDGGNQDNTGVLSLVQRNITNIIWFLNSHRQINRSFDFCDENKTNSSDYHPGESVDSALYSMFGYPYASAAYDYAHNQIFKKSDFGPYVCKLQTLVNAGKPATVRSKLEILPNTWWGIKGGWVLDSVLTYLEVVEDFESALPNETRAALKEGGDDPPFKNFPQMSTTSQNPGTFLGYTNAQVNLLAAQTEYSVRSNEVLFKSFMEQQ